VSGEGERGHMRHSAQHYPERSATPPDRETGWERGAVARCACGRAVVVRGKCTYCIDGLRHCGHPLDGGPDCIECDAARNCA
jgi:hypothetical protein